MLRLTRLGEHCDHLQLQRDGLWCSVCSLVLLLAFRLVICVCWRGVGVAGGDGCLARSPPWSRRAAGPGRRSSEWVSTEPLLLVLEDRCCMGRAACWYV